MQLTDNRKGGEAMTERMIYQVVQGQVVVWRGKDPSRAIEEAHARGGYVEVIDESGRRLLVGRTAEPLLYPPTPHFADQRVPAVGGPW
jgi:hypothetical protein